MVTFQVDVLKVSDSKKAFIKCLRTVGKLPLKKCENLYILVNRTKITTLVAGVDKEVADTIAGQLNDAGASARVIESSMRTPMICAPEVNQLYKWGALRTLTHA